MDPDAGWRVVAASRRGTGHEKTGQPCQDAHRYRLLPGGRLVAVVADGAGSAALGEVGADVAAQAALEAACARVDAPCPPEDDAFWHDLLLAALQAACTAVEGEAAARAVAARDLATTLILVVATPQLAAAAQVGDGAAIVADQAGPPASLTLPATGEYINETTFLTSPDALATAQVRVWRGTPAGLAVLSDGLQRLALRLPPGEPHGPFFAPLFAFAATPVEQAAAEQELLAFLGSPRVVARTDDDVTLLLAARVGPA
jgi:hypothetical protein